MTLPPEPVASNQPITPTPTAIRTIARVAKYGILRLITLFFAVVVGLYLTILVANFGGYIDKIYEGMINETILGMIRGGMLKELPEDQRDARIEEIRWELEEGFGLHQPFLLRTLNWLGHGLALDFGHTRYNYISNSPYRSENPHSIRYLISLALPYTLVLVGAANLLVFFISLGIALLLARNYGGLLDRALVALSPLSSIPPWVHGIWLVILFASQLHVLPFPRQIDILSAENWVTYVPFLSQYMVLPFLAIFLGAVFQSIYFWRTYFLIYAGEDYVDLARAKGLPERMVERNHIIRPTLPYIVTSFALTMIGLWQGAIALEVLFYWQGIGNMFIRAVRSFDTPMIVGIVVIFAYLLAVTVFLLDIVYALLDPRVRVGAEDHQRQAAKPWHRRLRFRHDRIKAAGSSITQAPLQRLQLDPLIPAAAPTASAHKSQSTRWQQIRPVLREILRYPSAWIGASVIGILILVSLGTIIFLPYEKTVGMWRREEGVFMDQPRQVPPAWINIFRQDKLPTTLIMDSRQIPSTRQITALSGEMYQVAITFTFPYNYSHFPQDLVIFMEPSYTEKPPLVNFSWVRPDGKELRLGQFTVPTTNSAFYVVQDAVVKRRYGDMPISGGLFAEKQTNEGTPLVGEYELRIVATTFQEADDFNARMVLYGRVFGLAGTDHLRRDLLVSLLWGTPVALAFGFLGAVVTTLLSLLISAWGAWFGGWVDGLIQRISEVNLILPVLPIAIMVFVMYSKSIWVILAVIVLLNIFGSGIKVYRAAFLQIRTLPYIEAAQSYGASNLRIIVRYLTPRILPVVVPQLVILVPGYVFYEATLAFLGISDPYLPTWGKMIYDALSVSPFQGDYYRILQPIALLLFTGLAFAMLGYTLDRVLNPRLREE